MANATDLARLLKLEGRKPDGMSEVLRMTLLAPDIVRVILDGRQPRHLNLHAMRGRQSQVPMAWNELRKAFGFKSRLEPFTELISGSESALRLRDDALVS